MRTLGIGQNASDQPSPEIGKRTCPVDLTSLKGRYQQAPRAASLPLLHNAFVQIKATNVLGSKQAV
jgi:hypothetical protein